MRLTWHQRLAASVAALGFAFTAVYGSSFGCPFEDGACELPQVEDHDCGGSELHDADHSCKAFPGQDCMSPSCACHFKLLAKDAEVPGTSTPVADHVCTPGFCRHNGTVFEIDHVPIATS